MLNPLLLTLVAIGHGCLAVLAVNVFHGLGVRESWMPRARALLLGAIGVGSLVLITYAWRASWDHWPIPIRAYAALCVATGAIGLPLVTLLRAMRRLPPGVRGRSIVVDLAAGRDRREFVGHGPDSWWLRLPGNQSFEFEFSEWQVESADFPPEFNGLSILHLTDLHLTPAYSRAFFDALFDRIAEIEADLVVFTGDLIDDEDHLEWVAPLLSRVRGRIGQFGVLGNHDYRHDVERALEALRAGGFTPVEAAWRLVEAEGRSIAVGGTSAPWGSWPAPPPVADFRLLLSHSPDMLYRAAADGIDLVLSGHTHGGQYRLPVFGPVLMPSVYSRRFDGGFFQAARTLMFVGRGIAGQHPLRFNCRPEVSRLILRSPSPPEHHVEHMANRRQPLAR